MDLHRHGLLTHKMDKSPCTLWHQDDHKNYSQLDTWGKANCHAQDLAAKFMATHPGYINKSFEADIGWTLKINGDNVVSQVQDDMYLHCTDSNIKLHLAKKHEFDEEYIDYIHWGMHLCMLAKTTLGRNDDG